MKAKWFKNHVAYTMAKFGMSMCTLGMSAEFAKDGNRGHSLWPISTIDTAAVRNLLGGATVVAMSRRRHHGRCRALPSSCGHPRETSGNLQSTRSAGAPRASRIFRATRPVRQGRWPATFSVPDEVFANSDTKIRTTF